MENIILSRDEVRSFKCFVLFLCFIFKPVMAIAHLAFTSYKFKNIK